MRILLDAYFDNNFGDDLFIDTLLKRYPEALFYVYWRKTPQTVWNRVTALHNLVILPDNCVIQESCHFDAYVMIGGDVLPDGIDYTARITHMKQVKADGGFVAMLGFSLYQEYGEKTIADLRTMAGLADTIVIRDLYSAERFQGLVPNVRVTQATDMVFTRHLTPAGGVCREEETVCAGGVCREEETVCAGGVCWEEETVCAGDVCREEEAALAESVCEKKQLLGIIPRRKLYSTDEQHLAYCRSQAKVADAYLQKYPESAVRFLAYSTGEYDDRKTAEDIIAQLQYTKTTENTASGGKAEKRVEIVSYEGKIESFCQAIGECTALLPTRFHGLVFALLNRQPFVPVPYEVKLTQLLEELHYEGICLPYGEEVSADMVKQAVEGLEVFGIHDKSLSAYEQKAAAFFTDMDRLYAQREAVSAEESTAIRTADTAVVSAEEGTAIHTADTPKQYREIHCSVVEDRDSLQAENGMLKQQVAELDRWIEALKAQRAEFEAQSRELEEIRRQQAQQLLEKEEQRQLEEQKASQLAQEMLQKEAELANQKEMAAKQNEELMKWVEALQKERAAFERQNRELEGIRQWQWNQLMKIPLLSRKIEEEYQTFLQTLREKLDKQPGL